MLPVKFLVTNLFIVLYPTGAAYKVDQGYLIFACEPCALACVVLSEFSIGITSVATSESTALDAAVVTSI